MELLANQDKLMVTITIPMMALEGVRDLGARDPVAEAAAEDGTSRVARGTSRRLLLQVDRVIRMLRRRQKARGSSLSQQKSPMMRMMARSALFVLRRSTIPRSRRVITGLVIFVR